MQTTRDLAPKTTADTEDIFLTAVNSQNLVPFVDSDRALEIDTILGSTLTLVEQSDYCDGLASEHATRAKALGELIGVLEAARAGYIDSASQIKEIAPKAANEGANLYVLSQLAQELKQELAELLVEEAGLVRLVDSFEQTLALCHEALASSRQTMLNSGAYTGEMPPEAYEAATLELATKDSSNKFAQSAAATIGTTQTMLEESRNNLEASRAKIGRVKTKLASVIAFSDEYTNQKTVENGTNLSSAKEIALNGLREVGSALTDEETVSVLRDAITMHVSRFDGTNEQYSNGE